MTAVLERPKLNGNGPNAVHHGSVSVGRGLQGVDPDCYPVTENNIKEQVRKAEYAVRGPIVTRALQLEQELADGKALPFSHMTMCNVGNPQILGQKPLTFLRQVSALVEHQALMDDPVTAAAFPSDAVARARELLAGFPGGIGAYTHSQGSVICRQHVAAGIAARDGHPADPNEVFMTDGASPGVHFWMKLLSRSENDCVLTPIPQYPLYSACLALYGATLLPYYLDEEHGWAMRESELRSQIEKARSEGKHVRALVVVNPGNPTGNVLEYDNQVEIVRLCAEFGLVLLADEVYQTNIYAQGKQFHSFKKVVRNLGSEAEGVMCVSFNSTSKGYFGECGKRGGYFEMINARPDLMAQMYKLVSINLCPNTSGQVAMSVIMNPPKEGEPSHALWAEERDGILHSLAERAKTVVAGFNRLKGVTCNETQGALYAFPRLTFPRRFVEEAAAEGRQPDFKYCSALMEATGIVCVPGSGFKQAPGTYHLRTTILPPSEHIKDMVCAIEQFHNDLWAKYE